MSQANTLVRSRTRPARNTPSQPGPGRPSGSSETVSEAERELRIRGYSSRSRKAYLQHIRHFLENAPESATAKGQAPSSDAIRAYLLHRIRHDNISRAYHDQAVSALKFLYRYVFGESAVVDKLPRPRAERRLPAVLARTEVEHLFEAVSNPKHLALLMLIYSSGLRVSETVRLRPGDVDAERGLLFVRGGKGRKDRYTVLSQRALDQLRVYRKFQYSDSWVFPGTRPDRHLSTRSVQNVVTRAKKAAGLQKRVTVHTLRHSFATHLLESGVDIRYIQELLGHASTRSTQIYTHVSRRGIERVRSPLDIPAHE